MVEMCFASGIWRGAVAVTVEEQVRCLDVGFVLSTFCSQRQALP